MTRRHWAVLIVAAWLVSLGWLAKRELFRSTGARLAEAALSVPPGALFYRLDLSGQQIGFASMTLDTLPDSIRVDEVVVLDVPALGRLQRTSARSTAFLSRALRLQSTDTRFEDDANRFGARGRVLGDSLLRVTVASDAESDSLVSRIRLTGPITLPTLLPLRLAFGERLEPGREYTARLFDPLLLAEREVSIRVAAESTLVVADSADLDSTTMSWVAVRYDTVRAFRLDQVTAGAGPALVTWIDAQGRVVRAATTTGFAMERSAFEIAYENFRQRDTARVARASADPGAGAVVPITPIAAGVAPSGEPRASLRVRLGDVELQGFAFAGGVQTLEGDILTIGTPTPDALRASYRMPWADSGAAPARWLGAEPLIEVRDPRIAAQARQVLPRERSPRQAAEALVRWVHANVRRAPPTGAPSAARALAARAGDSNEHATLFVALARAVGLPARTAQGLLYVDGRFYYHVWAEVYLRDWVAVDPTFGQFPADAAHVRFAVGGLARQLELVRVIGRLKLEVL